MSVLTRISPVPETNPSTESVDGAAAWNSLGFWNWLGFTLKLKKKKKKKKKKKEKEKKNTKSYT